MADTEFDAYEPVDYSNPPTMVTPQYEKRVTKPRRPPATFPKPAGRATYDFIPPLKSPSHHAMSGKLPPLPAVRRNLQTSPASHSPPVTKRPSPALKRPKSLDEGKLHKLSTEPIEESVSLSTFMAKHVGALPLRVRVDKGFYGAEDRNVISSGDIYNLHFVKKTKVVWIKDVSQHTYMIPLNSAVEIGLLYNPNNTLEEATRGVSFPAVSDIVSKDHLPKVIRVMATYSTDDVKSSVEKDEILIVDRVVRTGLRRRPLLKVFSIHKNCEKMLSEDCTGQFTTDPSSTRLYLPEILQYATESFPIKALLYINMDTPDDFPLHLTSEVVTLTHSSIETSLIATTQWDVSYTPTKEDTAPVDIPVDLDIEVTVLPSDGVTSEDLQLCSDTKNLYEKFDPAVVKTTRSRMLSQFFKVVRSDHARDGLELQKPERIYDVCVPSVRITEGSGDKSPMRFQPSPSPPSEVEVAPAVPERSYSYSTSGDASKQIRAEVRSLKALVDRLSDSTNKQVTSVKADVTRASMAADKLTKQVEKLQDEVLELRKQVAGLSASSRAVGGEEGSAVKAVSADVQAQNRQTLKSYSLAQVLQLLEAMNLKQYVEIFSEEHIDGELLIECDEDILETDLSVSRKLHRNRLMKVISGRHSAENIIKGEDPYVRLVH